MKTEEKLLLEIFPTKNRIFQQVKQQTELYYRHLASKALANGVTPPSWLWNPNNSISKELSKEELISELLPPGPPSRPLVRNSAAGSSQYSKPFITDYWEVANGFGVEAHASNKDGHDVAEGKNTIVEGDECIAKNTSNYLPELTVSSPAEFEDVRISNIYTAPDQSLARIQRSKSRQRAIEQRNSATSQAKKNSGNERTPRASYSGNKLFTLDYEQVDHINDSNILSEPCATSGEKQSAYHLRNENNIGACSNEIKLTALEPEQIHSVNERPRSTEPLFISSEGCRVKRKSETDNENSEGYIVKGKSQTDNENTGDGYNDHAGPVAMSKSSGSSRCLDKLTLRNSEDERTPMASSSGNKLFTLDNEQVDHINDSNILSEPCATSGGKQSAYHLRNENNIGACSNEIKSTALEPGQIHSVNECPRSPELLFISSEGCRVKRKSETDYENSEGCIFEGKSQTDNENSGDRYNDHAGPVTMSKSSGSSRCLDKPTLRNSEVEKKDSIIFNKSSITSRDIIKIDRDIGSCIEDCQSYQKGVIVHPENSTRSKSSGKSCEEAVSKKEESGIEDKRSDVYVEKSSTPKRPAQHENRLSDFEEENYFSDCVPGKDVDNITSCNDPESSNHQICSFDGLLEQTCFENGSGNWILPPNAGQGVSDIRESDLEDGQSQNDNDPKLVRVASSNKASLPDENLYLQMMDADTYEELRCESVPPLVDNQFSVTVKETDRSDHKRSEDRPLNSQTLKAASNFGSAGRSFAQFQGSAGEKPIYEDNLFQRASGDHVVLPCLYMCDNAEQLEPANEIEAVEPGTVKLAETFHVSKEDEYRKKSLGNSCSPFPNAAAGVPRDSLTTNKAGDSGVQTTKSEPRRSCHYELEARQNNGEHSPSIKAASTQLNPSNTIDDVNVSYERCEFSSELLVEEEKCYSTNYENIVNNSQKNSEASARSRWTEEGVESTIRGLFPSTNPSCLSNVYATNHEDEQRLEIKSDDYPLGIEKLSSSEGISSKGRLSVQVVGHRPQHSDHSPLNKDLELMINDGRNLPDSISEEGHSKRKFVEGEDDIRSLSVQSPHVKGLCAIDFDQSRPELELFLVDSQSENDTMGFPGDMINFDNLELSRSTIARVTMLERLCKSASACTPLSHLSSTFKMDKVPDLFHSVPNGLLEHTDLGGLHFGDDVKEFRESLSTSSEAEGDLQGVSCTNNLPCAGTPMGVSSVIGLSYPEGRFWEGYSSRSSSSGKRLSSNPEFECFTIKEDPCTSEGNESADEDSDKLSKDVGSLTVNCHAIDSDKFLEDGDSLTVHCAAREPSTGTHNKYKSSLRSFHCTAREPSTGTHNKYRSSLRSSHKKKGTGKYTQTPLLVADGKRMAKESLSTRYKKAKTSGKSSLKNERLDRTREPYSSNIVSNMTSFIPLIQQKQAAAKACPGKREIKVKALEAAEAAKRLEEKRENERKLKKEALKTERARMIEQEKAKQIELFKKKKEDEQRKKDAEILLRKRMREEEERKEERKRARTEDARQKQRDQEEKLHAKKGGNMDIKKRSNHELKLPQMKKPGGYNVKLDNESSSAAISSIDIQQASTCSKEGSYSADLFDNKQENCTPVKVKASYFVRDHIQEKSYEISPYQGSDDEDDEDELHTTKFVPSWASKNLVAESLSLMREVHPSVIFPPSVYRSSINEVLLPRKLQQVSSML